MPFIDHSLVSEIRERFCNVDKCPISGERIFFENQSISGSISLKGAAIDDLTFKEYNVSLESNEKVKFLSPRSSKEGYLIVRAVIILLVIL